MHDGVMLLVDGHTVEPLSAVKIRRFLRHAPQLIKMHAITEPLVVATPGGWTGFVIVAESHISVETQGRHLWADLFSCAAFDTVRAERIVRRLLGLVECRARTVERPMPPARSAGALP